MDMLQQENFKAKVTFLISYLSETVHPMDPVDPF